MSDQLVMMRELKSACRHALGAASSVFRAALNADEECQNLLGNLRDEALALHENIVGAQEIYKEQYGIAEDD